LKQQDMHAYPRRVTAGLCAARVSLSTSALTVGTSAVEVGASPNSLNSAGPLVPLYNLQFIGTIA